MAKKDAVQEGYSGRFVGKYVQEIRLMTEATMVTGLHGLLIGAPGYGKTEIAMDVFRTVTNGQYIFQRLDPSTPPSALKPKRQLVMVDGHEAIVENPNGTMYQPGMRAGIMDEIARANSAVFDAMLDIFDRKDIAFGEQVVMGTANFMPTSERQAALIDRIAFWQWVQPEKINPSDIVEAQLFNLNAASSTSDEFLTLEKIDWVRGLIPTKKAAKATGAFVEMIAIEATKAGFEVNPRRLFQWGMAAFKWNAYLQESNDFEDISPEAAYILRWMMPSLTKNDYDKWQDVAKAFADVVGTAVDEAIKSLEKEMRKIAKESPSNEAAPILAVKFMDAKRALEERFPGDKKVAAATKQMDNLYNDFCLGKFAKQ